MLTKIVLIFIISVLLIGCEGVERQAHEGRWYLQKVDCGGAQSMQMAAGSELVIRDGGGQWTMSSPGCRMEVSNFDVEKDDETIQLKGGDVRCFPQACRVHLPLLNSAKQVLSVDCGHISGDASGDEEGFWDLLAGFGQKVSPDRELGVLHIETDVTFESSSEEAFACTQTFSRMSPRAVNLSEEQMERRSKVSDEAPFRPAPKGFQFRFIGVDSLN